LKWRFFTFFRPKNVFLADMPTSAVRHFGDFYAFDTLVAVSCRCFAAFVFVNIFCQDSISVAFSL
jgi:hypothetical protein